LPAIEGQAEIERSGEVQTGHGVLRFTPARAMLGAMLVDTHCHLNDVEAFPDPDRAIEEALAAGVGRLIVVGVDPTSSELAVEIAERHPSRVFATAGWHPNYAASFDEAGLDRIVALMERESVVALGEIGLDEHWDFASPAQQDRALCAQLEIAADFGKPIVFHCREAYPRLIDALEARPDGDPPYIFHCFSGDADEARRALALGGWFGVDGPITYRKADALRSLVATLPRDRLLIETDSPWMTPHPRRSERNRPAFLPLINEGLASALGITGEACAALTTGNATRLFGLP